MSSSHESSFPQPVINAGQYIVVDVVDILIEYLKIRPEVRRPEVIMADEYSDRDALEVELTMIVPCLDDYDSAENCLTDHGNEILENVWDMDPDIIDQVDGSSISVTKFDETTMLPYASSVVNLGLEIRERMKEHFHYKDDGTLVGEFVSVVGEGLILLRQV